MHFTYVLSDLLPLKTPNFGISVVPPLEMGGTKHRRFVSFSFSPLSTLRRPLNTLELTQDGHDQVQRSRRSDDIIGTCMYSLREQVAEADRDMCLPSHINKTSAKSAFREDFRHSRCFGTRGVSRSVPNCIETCQTVSTKTPIRDRNWYQLLDPNHLYCTCRQILNCLTCAPIVHDGRLMSGRGGIKGRSSGATLKVGI